MTETIMQCCYTNAVKEGGGTVASGWQAVAVSDGLPSDAYAGCVNLQSAHSLLQEDLGALRLLEVAGDGAYVYVCRTQFGLTDRLGRPNLFSHAYIFSWRREEVLEDPNLFLTLEESNFARDEASAAVRTALVRREPFTLAGALERAGMTEDTYRVLLQCVYAQFTQRQEGKPLFVQYDGTEEQMMAILYCVYRGMPYCVRRNLSAASAASGGGRRRDLVFSVQALGEERFLLPQTGENNLLTPRMARRIARCGFVDYAAGRGGETADYFRRLEELALELGDASDELTLKIAHQMLEAPPISELEEGELYSRLSDALRVRDCGSGRMEDYIREMLEEVCRRGLVLTEESERNLARWLAGPVQERLADAGEKYNLCRLRELPPEDAARRLNSLSRPVFDRYGRTLRESFAGLEILDVYYAVYGLERQPLTWAGLEAFWLESRRSGGGRKTKDAVDAAAWRLYDAELELPDRAQAAYDALMRLMGCLLSPERLSGCGLAAKERYWEKQSLETFSRARGEEYRAMADGSGRSGRFIAFCTMLDAYSAGGDGALFRAFRRFVEENAQVFAQPQQIRPFRKRLEEELLAISPGAETLFPWLDVLSQPEEADLAETVEALREDVARRNFDALVDVYRQAPWKNGRAVSEALARECQAADTPEQWVPVDVWLVMGASIWPGNAFRIFDEAERQAVLADPALAAAGSCLLEEEPYTSQAEAYVRRKGTAHKAVHGWLNEVKAARRRRQAEERRSRKESEGSVLDWGRNIFTQLTSGGERQGRRVAGKEAKQGRRIAGKDGKKDEPAKNRSAPLQKEEEKKL